MIVPFFDLKKQNRLLKRELDAVFLKGLLNADFILGAELEKFEKNFARYVGSQYAAGVNSGLDALSLALRVLDIGPGDEVILPANSFIATALAVTSVGARPVFADVDPEHLLIDLDSVKKALTRRTRAVIPVHLYGQPVDMKPLSALCRRKGLYVVEDACQAHGAAAGAKRCGSLGDLGCFSFYPGKNLGALGDGGLVTTDDKVLYHKLLLYRNYGSIVKYEHLVAGMNTRLDALQASFLNVKLRYLDGWNRKRSVLAARYCAGLKNLRDLTLIPERRGFTHAHHLYVIRTDRRDALRDHLAKNGIGTNIHYPVPIHRQAAYRNLLPKAPLMPVTDRESRRLISLPMYPEMRLREVDRVCSVIRNFFCS